MVFDIKMEDLRRKACLVVGECVTDARCCYLPQHGYRETVCIALTMEALKDLDVNVAYVFNANVMAPDR